MECACTEDKEVLEGGVIIGRNRVTCQYCLDNNAIQEKNRQKQDLMAQIKDLEGRIYYSQLDGATSFVESKMAQRVDLKQQLIALG